MVRLERIISNTFANFRDIGVNSHIIIADQLMADGAEFADDMVPGRGERVLVFLRRLPRLQHRDQKAFTLYQYVAAYVSKYELSPDNRLTPMSVRTTVLSNQMAGQRLDDIVSTALFQSRTGFRAIIGPIGFNDISRGYAQYKTALATNPWAVEQQFATRDAQRAGVVFHAH